MDEREVLVERLMKFKDKPMNLERAEEFLEIISVKGSEDIIPHTLSPLLIELWIQAKPLLEAKKVQK